MPRALVLVVSVVVGSTVAACAAPRPTGLTFTKPAAPVAGAPSAVVGTWQVDDDSRTVMEIAEDGGSLRVRAWTGDDDVAYDVTGVSFDGARLRATFTYPPTKFTTTSNLELSDADTLEGPVTGAYEGYERWRRVKR